MDKIIIFTDGASSGNPGPGGWGTIVCTPNGRVVELGGNESHTTNNRMELMAAIQGLEAVLTSATPVDVFTDSTYLIQGMTRWIHGWKRREWISAEGKPVANQDLWMQLDALTQHKSVQWHYVRGHAGTAGNERADQIAVQCASGNTPTFFDGKLSEYGVDLLNIPKDTSLPIRTSDAKTSGKTQNYFYISLVDHIPMRHRTWAECEQRVKGRSGAKYRKLSSDAEEEKILKEWGISTRDLRT